MSTTNPINRTTEWDDLQIKYGNYAALPKETKNEELSLKAQDLVASIDPLANKSLKELARLEDDVDEDTLAVYRQRRLEELKERQKRARFGTVVQVGMSEYVDEITNASKENTVVICHLYKDGKPECQLINKWMDELARGHPDVKFCKGISDHLVPNYQDKNLPALLIYRNGACERQIVGTSLFGGPQRMSRESLEWVLAKKCRLFATDLEEDPLEEGVVSRGHKGTRMRVPGARAFDSDDSESSSDSEDEVRGGELNTVAFDRGYGDTEVDRVMSQIRR